MKELTPKGESKMSGYGGPDDELANIASVVENGIDLARSRLGSGPSSHTCHECGEDIPEGRRKASPGCKYCVECQAKYYDKLPKIKTVDWIL